MASVKLMLYTYKELKDGTHPIVLSVIKDRKRKLISTGYSAIKAHWKTDNKGLNSRHPHQKKLNALLTKKRMDAENAIIELESTNKPFSVHDVAELLLVDRKSSSFKRYSEHLISKLDSAGKKGNAVVYRTAQKAILKFMDDKDIDLKNITPRFLNQFRQSLLEKGVKTNAISVYMRTLRAIYNKAIQDDLVSEKYYPFKNFNRDFRDL